MAATHDITGIRRKLVAESNDFHQRSKAYLHAMKSPGSTSADFDAFEGLATGGIYAWVLAVVLRRATEDYPDFADKLALIIGESMNSGVDWLEHANADLDGASGVTP